MGNATIARVVADLLAWCRDHDYAGYDPFDGLNSKLFQASPLKNSRRARLLWTQACKRSPLNFRKMAQVSPQPNAKGIALLALATLTLQRLEPENERETEARELMDQLLSLSLKGFSGAAWGYNFDWQGRAFFAPRGTPTVVPTAFAARALVEAAELLDTSYLPLARSACNFILNDLNRSEPAPDEVCFSYTPLDHTQVFNASLLAGETLAVVGKLTSEPSLVEWGMRAARYVVRRQRADGSWAYGADNYQSWTDNFHTAFILTSLARIIDSAASARTELEPALVRGYEFWRERFFLSNGWPKYYDDRLYPADAHSAAAAVVSLMELRGRVPQTTLLAEKVVQWSLENLHSPKGYFYYQVHRFYKNRIPYMRWSEAWMAYALTSYLAQSNK